jgi:predicted RNase H-like HicB family nuclease
MMRFTGRVLRVGRRWAVEVPALGVVSEGHTRKDALEMIRDAIESLVNKPGFEVHAFPADGNRFEIAASKDAPLVALLLRRKRLQAGLTLSQVAAARITLTERLRAVRAGADATQRAETLGAAGGRCPGVGAPVLR